MKALVYFLFRGFQMHGTSFIGWIVSAAIETLILSLIVGGIAKLCGKDFTEWFQGAFGVVGAIEIIIGIIALFF